LDALLVVTVLPMIGHRPLGGPGYFDADSIRIEWKTSD
jgi:hypothetical protein